MPAALLVTHICRISLEAGYTGNVVWNRSDRHLGTIGIWDKEGRRGSEEALDQNRFDSIGALSGVIRRCEPAAEYALLLRGHGDDQWPLIEQSECHRVPHFPISVYLTGTSADVTEGVSRAHSGELTRINRFAPGIPFSIPECSSLEGSSSINCTGAGSFSNVAATVREASMECWIAGQVLGRRIAADHDLHRYGRQLCAYELFRPTF